MRELLFFAILFLSVIRGICGPQELADAIHYTPPRNLAGGVETQPSGDNPFPLVSPVFLHYTTADGIAGEVFFQVGLVGAHLGPGKTIKCLPITSSIMEDELKNQYRDLYPGVTSASINQIGGLNAVSLTGTQPGRVSFFHFCWIQVETNIVVEISTSASDSKTFQEITNSLHSITIDKEQFLSGLMPKEADVITNHLERAEVGHIQQNNDRLGVCVFYTKEKLYSFTVAHIFSKTVDDLDGSVASFERLRDFSSVPNALRTVLIDIAPGIPQTSLCVEAETNSEAIGRFQAGISSMPTIALIWQFWDNQIPSGFQKESDYKMDATLYVRKEPPEQWQWP